MKKIKSYLITFIKILLEHATLIATVVASTYIITSSQLKQYSDTTLLLWIISLLGLVAASIVSEKYFKLNRINKDIESIKNSLKQKEGQLDEMFITRKNQKPLEERIENANTIFLSGGSLARISDEYYACFEERLKDQCNIEVVLVRPFSVGAELLCKNVVYEPTDKDVYSQKIVDSLERFMRLKEKFPQLVTVRVTDNTPPFGIMGIDLGKNNARIQVEIYSYAVPTRERIQININKSDEKSYKFFIDQINTLKEQSQIYMG